MDATDYKMGTDKEQTEANETVGSGLTWTFIDKDKSEESDRTRERS